MKFSISINQKAIVDNGFNIKGSSLETWALLDFLLFFQNANNLKKINKDDKCYIWINYKYIINNSPLCHFYNASIKKHLNILCDIGLIEIFKDADNNVYFRFTSKIESLFLEDNNINNQKNFNHLVKNLTSPSENFNQGLVKNLTTIINKEPNNNKYNNIYIKKEKNKKEKSKKEILREEAITLFKEEKEKFKNNLTLDDWIEWVDYKLEKETKITLATFKKNIKQLISFGENAKQSIDVSISSNWSGLFAVKEQINNKQGKYTSLDNKSDFRGVSVRNKEECNWFLDFLDGDERNE